MTLRRLGSRLSALVGYKTRMRVGEAVAGLWRRAAIRNVPIVAIAGSMGKTATKDMTYAVLEPLGRGAKTFGNVNFRHDGVLLSTMPWHRFAVVEMSEADLDSPLLARHAALVRPSIVVVTNVGTDHLSIFTNEDGIAREFGRLVAAVPADGVAVLNADDPRVLALAPLCRGRVVTVGTGTGADIRAEAIADQWPERLSFDVVAGARRATVRMQLCGAQWVTATLAALAVADVLGVPWEAALERLAERKPTTGRMQPVERADGVGFVMDDYKCSYPSIAPALAYLARARAQRKIAVIGTISDFKRKSSKLYRQVARDALAVADMVIFAGDMAARAKGAADATRLRVFVSRAAAAAFLSSYLRPGDLVLVKANRPTDHLQFLAEVPLGGPTPTDASAPDTEAVAPAAGANLARGIIGLGNKDAALADSPHSLGHRVVDDLARNFGATWETRDSFAAATATHDGVPLVLIKNLTLMNDCGPAVAAALTAFDLASQDCFLVVDDVAVKLGTVRNRDGGSDGGHQGVRSVLRALDTDAIARIKIGVRTDRRDG
jgi:UDP-N-acetylmuramoyl-tripeptide--D-alanyl-D-alanine ligase